MSKRYQNRMLFIGVFSLLVLYGARPAFAQEAQQTQKKQSPEQHVQIYRIKHQDAQDLAVTIGQFAGTNTMVANADTPRTAVDRQTNSLIVAGNEKTHELISTLLQSLDVEPKKVESNEPAAHDVMIRVVWLVDEGLVEGDATAIPPDLISTVEKLRTQFGLGSLVTAGQIIINQHVVQQTKFSGSGTASIQGKSQFFADGMARCGDDEVFSLEVSVVTESLSDGARMGKAGPSSNATCELASKISAPIGRPVFFGMAPIESKTSLFVVQVLDADALLNETPR